MPRHGRHRAIVASTVAMCFGLAFPASALDGGRTWDEVAAAQSRGNSQPGPRSIPPRVAAPPREGVSSQGQAVIARPYLSNWNDAPTNAAEWDDFVRKAGAPTLASLPALRETLGVTVQPQTIGGVKVFVVQPRVVPVANAGRTLVHLHGGGYVLGPGEIGTREAILMAAHGGFRVVSIDYRMPPSAPYPAALDDAMSVYREIVRTGDPRKVALFGTSTGGGMILAMILRAKAEGLPLPAAIAPGTPWSDLTAAGDSYATNEFVDSVLVSWKGWLGRAALLYANGVDLKNPYLSPIYGDFSGFPPTILTTGTRDLFLSNTVRTHRKLRQAGVDAVLNVFEGQSHAQYYAEPTGPETVEYHAEVVTFFDRYLAR